MKQEHLSRPWCIVAKDGWRFLLPLLVVGILALALGWGLLGWTALAVAAFVGFFFRDPERLIPRAAGCIVSPADGRVVSIRKDERRPGLDTEYQTVSIFLSLFDVHVNRAPCDAEVERVEYSAGRFLPAFRGEASQSNEQNRIILDTGGPLIEVKQIAGLLARRIVCWVKPGDSLERGQRVGLIRFGSRVDVTFPASATLLVREGSKVKGGVSVLARRAS
jgi:phosphatidylserine decarboxylase